MTKHEALHKYTLRLADDALILGHRLSEWCSNAPFIEEDLALTNFALDMTGRARALLSYAGTVEGQGRDEDMLAYLRSEREYYNHLLVEQPDIDFAFAMAKQLFIAAFERRLFAGLQLSHDEMLAGIAAKTLKEVNYHFIHARDWVIRLGNGTSESHSRMQRAIDDLWMYTDELFEMDKVDTMLLADHIAVDLVPIKAAWAADISGIFAQANLTTPSATYMQTGGRNGIHTESLGHLLTEMQYLQRAYPDAKW